MKDSSTNRLAAMKVPKLIWTLGLPMILSMVLQAVYNIVDTAFVINMGEGGVDGNLALTYAFPVQLLIIAIGVGTGIGINAVLSRSLGEGNEEKASKIVGNGIFLGIGIYAAFLIFGLFFSRAFVSMQANGNGQAVGMGTEYLTICCCFSFGAIGFTIYERFLQATGKTLLSTIAQIAGALTNILLDYVFIYPMRMGVAGAAWATVVGQCVSLIVAMAFHYLANREIKNSLSGLKPSGSIILSIYRIGWSAILMQGLLSVMMLGVNLILGGSRTDAELLQGSFGIYYKIMQFALFAVFGISNTIITALSFNFGMGDKKRSRDCIRHGLIMSVCVALFLTALFELLSEPLAALFSLAEGESGEITLIVVKAVRVGAIGYAFMGFSVGVQGVFQALRHAVRPLVISLLRLVVFVFPLAFLFTLSPSVASLVWWTFPLAELLTAIVSGVLFVGIYRKDIAARAKA